MRKFWIVLLAAGLFMAFTMPAIAAVGGADVKFSGTLRMRGWYDDNITLLKDASLAGANRGSQAFFDNRLRMVTEFKVAEGLALVTRFDALERKWGQTLNNGLYAVDKAGTVTSSGALTSFNDSISFERAYVDFTTGIGRFLVGYQQFLVWGTIFGDSDTTYPGIKYMFATGPLTVVAALEKRSESTLSPTVSPANRNMAYNAGLTDIDQDVYDLGVIYKFTGGDAGIMWQYVNSMSSSSTTQSATPYKQKIHLFNPYVKYKAGPVYVEAEAAYVTGKYAEYDRAIVAAATKDVDITAYGAYLKAEVDLVPAYVGLKFAYVSGNDTATADKVEGSILTGMELGNVHDFAVMLGNYEYFYQIAGSSATSGTGWKGNNATAVDYGMDNIVAYQLYGGFKPTPKLDVKIAYTYATVQQKPVGYESDKIGSEFDLVASYKIFDNLTYTFAAGYFWTGDYFKAATAATTLDNDYLIMHQLMLSF
jgi:hypothetical protein